MSRYSLMRAFDRWYYSAFSMGIKQFENCTGLATLIKLSKSKAIATFLRAFTLILTTFKKLLFIILPEEVCARNPDNSITLIEWFHTLPMESNHGHTLFRQNKKLLWGSQMIFAGFPFKFIFKLEICQD